jgi:hypothetical protein
MWRESIVRVSQSRVESCGQIANSEYSSELFRHHSYIALVAVFIYMKNCNNGRKGITLGGEQ